MSTPLAPVAVLSAAGLVLGLAAAAGATDVKVRAIAASGDLAPGFADGTTFGVLSEPRISHSGRVAFWADLKGRTTTEANDGSIWSDRSGSIQILLREGSLEPSGSGSTFAGFPIPAFSHAGRFAAAASLLTGDGNHEVNLALYHEIGPGTLDLLGREGEIAEGFEADHYLTLPPIGLSRAGRSAFAGSVGFDDDRGLWSADAGSLSLHSATGDQAPGQDPGILFRYIAEPLLASEGAFVFRATASNIEDDQFPVQGLWIDTGSPGAIAAAGDPAPGTEFETVFDLFSDPSSVDAIGQAAFHASLFGPAVNDTNDRGLWVARQESVDYLAREGDPAPGLEPASFARFSSRIAHSAAGDLAFVGFVSGEGIDASNNSGLWTSDTSGVPALLAREGEQAATLPDGVQYAIFGDPAMNASGQVAFVARLRGPGVAPETSAALFATDRAGALVKVLRLGDAVDLRGDGSDVRTVGEISFDSGPLDSGFEQFNAAGTIVLKAHFTDDSHALLVATLGCLADFNADGATNLFDFLAFQAAFGNEHPTGDINGDGLFNLFDFLGFQTAFGNGCD